MTVYDVLTGEVVTDSKHDGLIVNGTFAKPGDEYTGLAKVPRMWTEDALKEAAEKMIDVPITKQLDSFEVHPGVEETEDGLRVAPSAPVESFIGRVTDARLDEDLGLIWQGELTDDTFADLIGKGHVEVSPVVGLETEDRGDKEEIVSVKKVRDLTAIPKNTGALPNASASIGKAEAMSQAFDESAESDEGSKEQSNMEDLSDKEQELLALSRQVDNPTVVDKQKLQEIEDQEEMLQQIEGVDDPTVVEKEQYEQLTSNVETVREVLEDALVEKTELKESTVEALTFDALCGEFTNEDGDFTVDALTQDVETGEPPEDEGDDPVDYDALSNDQQSEINGLLKRANTFESANRPDYAEQLREEAADVAGVSDYDALSEVME